MRYTRIQSQKLQTIKKSYKRSGVQLSDGLASLGNHRSLIKVPRSLKPLRTSHHYGIEGALLNIFDFPPLPPPLPEPPPSVGQESLGAVGTSKGHEDVDTG